jgi:hypothetical protein
MAGENAYCSSRNSENTDLKLGYTVLWLTEENPGRKTNID